MELCSQEWGKTVVNHYKSCCEIVVYLNDSGTIDTVGRYIAATGVPIVCELKLNMGIVSSLSITSTEQYFSTFF